MEIIISNSDIIDKVHLLSANISIQNGHVQNVATTRDDERFLLQFNSEAIEELYNNIAQYCEIEQNNSGVKFVFTFPVNTKQISASTLLSELSLFLIWSIVARWFDSIKPEIAMHHRTLGQQLVKRLLYTFSLRDKPLRKTLN